MVDEDTVMMKLEIKSLQSICEQVIKSQAESNKVASQLTESNVRLSTEIGHLVSVVEKNTTTQDAMKKEFQTVETRVTRIEERIGWMPNFWRVIMTLGVGIVFSSVVYVITIKGI